MVERTHESSHHQSQPWIFTTLGQLALVGAPEPPAMMSHAAWSVLAYLACAPNRQPIPRERIQRALFEEVNQSAHMLRNAIYVLRKWLSDAIVVTRSHLSFAPHVVIAVDAVAFLHETQSDATIMHRMRAVARYHGQFLVKPQYGWVREMAMHLHERYVVTLNDLLHMDASHGRSRWLLAYAQRYVREREWDQDAHERLIRLLLANGRHAHHHIATARRLIDPMPSDWTERMVHLVEHAYRHTRVDPKQQCIERLTYIDEVPFPKHIMIHDALRLIWQVHHDGHPQFVVIRGDSGTGKTQLLKNFVKLNAEIRTVWFGRAKGSSADDTVFGRLQFLMTHHAQLRDEVMQIYAQLTPAQRHILLPNTHPHDSLIKDANVPYVLRADALMQGFVRFVADQPLLLIVDDASLDVIHELADLCRQVPQLMVIVVSEEQGDGTAATARFVLDSLTADDITYALDTLLLADVPPALCDDLIAHVHTLFQLSTSLRHLLMTDQLAWQQNDDTWIYQTHTLPDSMLTVSLKPAALQLLQLIALIDGSVAIDEIVVRPWGYRRRIRNLLAQLEDLQLIERTTNHVRIADSMVRQRILAHVSLAQRTQLHQLAMESTSGITKATHAIQLGEVALAQTILHDESDRAWRQGDVHLLRHVFRLIQQLPLSNPDIQWLFAVNAVRMGRFGAAPIEVRRAIEMLQQLSSPSSQRHYEALIGAGISLRWAGYPRESIDVLMHVYDESVRRRLPRLTFAAAHALTFAYVDHGQASKSLVMLDSMQAPKTKIVSQVIIALTQSYVYARIGDFDRAERSFEMIARYKLVMNVRTQALISYHAGVIALAKCDHMTTQRQLSTVYQTMFDVGDMVTNLMAGAIMCMDLVRFGRSVEAEHLVHMVLERSTTLQLLRQRLMALFGYLHILVHQQRWSEAKHLAEHALDEAHAAGLIEYEAALAAFMLRASHVMNDRKQQALLQCIDVHNRMDDPYAFGWYHEIAWFYWVEGNQSEALRWALLAESKAHMYTTAAVLPVTILAVVAMILQECQHRQYLTTRNRAVELLINHLRDLPSIQARIDFVRNNRGLSMLIDVFSLTTGDVVVWLPAADAPRGRRLRDEELIPVIWPGAILRNQARSLTDKIQQLALHAESQGATVMVRDLAKVLFVHERTILRAVSQAAEQGIVIRTYRPRRASS
ncbi:MAG: Bacterial transcriptional activator domain [Chloroflexota bacterium]|jgi:DNA-binding SARP family transcriptional activator